MRNTGILLLLVGTYIIINSGSFRDVVLGKAKVNFVNPTDTGTTSGSIGGGGGSPKKK